MGVVSDLWFGGVGGTVWYEVCGCDGVLYVAQGVGVRWHWLRLKACM